MKIKICCLPLRMPKIHTNNFHFLHISTAQSWRGGEQQLAYLYEEINKQAVRQTIVCAKNSELEKHCIETKKEFISIQKKGSFDLAFAAQLKKISSEDAILHVHDSHAHTAAVLSSILFRNKAPIIVSRRVDFKIGDNFLSSFKYNYSGVKKIICVSDAIKKIISPEIKDQTKLVTIHDGVDLNKFNVDKKITRKLRTEFNIHDNNYYLIGNVAALAPHKDYYTFIDTASIIIQKNIKAKFLMIGEGPERKKLEDYIKQKNMSDHIIMTGFRTDIKEILPELDIFLITSETEGLGSSILDAMLCKVPIVATSAGGIPEIVKHNETGLLAPTKNAKMLAENIVMLISNVELKNNLVVNASNEVKKFSKEIMAAETLGVYKEIGINLD